MKITQIGILAIKEYIQDDAQSELLRIFFKIIKKNNEE